MQTNGAYQSVKQAFKAAFPHAFDIARDIKDRLKIEALTLKQVGFMPLVKLALPSKASAWRAHLPVQSISSVTLVCPTLEALLNNHTPTQEGTHTVYFSPEAAKASALAPLLNYFPDTVGIKIVKQPGGLDSSYAMAAHSSQTQRQLAPSHEELVLVHNLFFQRQLSPRLYDLLEIHFAQGDVHMAYAVEHIAGEAPTQEGCQTFIEKIKTLENQSIIRLINWNGYSDQDFQCPTCNGNLLEDKQSKRLCYVDLQNFALGNYHQHLKKTALQASSASHFGDKSYVLGGEFLYQSVPGLNLPAKRSPQVRYRLWQDHLNQCGLRLKDKLVLDVGCNMGLMSACYLGDGAAWIHGFDLPDVAPHTQAMLLALGCTRFSVTGLHMDANTDLLAQLPPHTQALQDNLIISYLAIRGHIGWIKQLRTLPWQFMLYEGHEKDSLEDNHGFIEELNRLHPCRILTEAWIEDGSSRPRYMAIIQSAKS